MTKFCSTCGGAVFFSGLDVADEHPLCDCFFDEEDEEEDE